MMWFTGSLQIAGACMYVFWLFHYDVVYRFTGDCRSLDVRVLVISL